MEFISPDIETFRVNLESCINSVLQLETDNHHKIKIQSLLNVSAYVMATRFLEASVKQITYNCCKMRGDNQAKIAVAIDNLKSFNNPEFANIKDLILANLDYDILIDKGVKYTERDISFLNEICRNRHRNVHASFDSREWYNTNFKDITNDFVKEYIGLKNIIHYLEIIKYNKTLAKFET